MIKTYKGKKGKFKYDDTEFQKQTNSTFRYIGKETDGAKITIPEGMTDCSYLFAGCDIKTPPVIPEGVTNCNGMFDGCTKLKKAPSLPSTVETCDYMFLENKALTEAMLFIPAGVQSCMGMFERCTGLITPPAFLSGVKNCYAMFFDCISLQSAPYLFEGTKNCSYMFSNCKSLEDVPNFPAGIKKCNGMFTDCTSLPKDTVVVLPESVTSWDNIFYYCGIKPVVFKKYEGPLGKFVYDTAEFKIIQGHLHYIGAQTDGKRIKIPHGITDCRYMFSDSDITIPPVIPKDVTNCIGMFKNCYTLKEAPVIPNGVTNCNDMFHSCRSLVNAPVIPESVTSCCSMFQDCSSLTKGPVIPTSVTDSRYMFCNCTSLQERPDVPDHLIDKQSYAIFHNCPDPTVATIEDDIKPEETNKTEQSDICSSCIHKDICANRKTYGEAITQYIADFGCKYYKE